MARKRMIDPDFWVDDKTGTIEPAAQILFIGMWNFADDEGLIHFSSAYLRSCIFPHKDLPLAEIDKLKGILLDKELVFKYSIDGQDYAWISNFRNHQVINKPQPSKIPPPSIQNTDYHRQIFRRDKYQCHLCGQQCVNPNTGPDADWEHKGPSVDHIIPQSQGGSNYPSNLKTACLSCNKGRGNKSLPSSYRNDAGTLQEPDGLKEEKRKEKKSIPPNKGGQHKVLSHHKSEQKGSVVNEIFAEMRSYLGYPGKADKDPIPNYGKEGQAVKRMLTRGFTREEVTSLWKQKVDVRGGEFVSMMWVNEDIGKPQKQRQGARQLPTGEEIERSIREIDQ